MRAYQLTAWQALPEMREIPVPEPGPGQGGMAGDKLQTDS
jgi:hypothetical protein